MSQAHSGTESCIGSSTTSGASAPTIESGRFERAVSEAMTVERVAERFYEIHSQSGSTYEIDLQTGACTCPDCQQRGEQYVCKHAIRASLVEVVAEGVSTPTVAKVAGYARDPEHTCPTEGHGGECAGPLAVAGELPCPTCCDATRSEETDEYHVWNRVVAPDRNREQNQPQAQASAKATASTSASAGLEAGQ
jgi:hypothetical protein